ncbi:MAG: hypothetical protein KIT60_04000 [Burkholderiaceae bacterium]|nr:hypothetical protein [Burkholderiaceae bacterium]
MKSKLCDMLGVDVPIFAFSHCRDVVAEVTKAGGMGVLGVAYKTAAQLDVMLMRSRKSWTIAGPWYSGRPARRPRRARAA